MTITTCHCDQILRDEWSARGVEVHVQPAPAVVLMIVTCPHGSTWISEPTGQQLAKWVEEQG